MRRLTVLALVVLGLAVPSTAVAAPHYGAVDAATGAETVLGRARSPFTAWRSLRWSPGASRSVTAVRTWHAQPRTVISGVATLLTLRGVAAAELAPGGDRAAELRSGPRGLELTLRPIAAQRRAVRRRLTGRDPFSRPVARWAPDGSRLAVAWYLDAARWRVAVVDVATLRVSRAVTGRGDLDLAVGAWSPDGRRLAFSVGRARERLVPLSAELRVLEVGTGGSRTLARPDVWIEDAAWAPGGDRLALSYDFAALGLLGALGGSMTTIDLPGDDEVHALAWSPDGRSIAIAHAADFEAGVSLGVMDLAGRRLRALRRLGPGEVTELAWSPDGVRVAYALRTA
jgi:dipeptidyl aminopeptidase/acylaminoacyl peptidase